MKARETTARNSIFWYTEGMLFGKSDECRGARKSMRSLLIGFLIGGAVTSIVGSKLLASQENEEEKNEESPKAPKEPQES